MREPGVEEPIALEPWEALRDGGCAALRAIVRPLSRAIVESGAFASPP